jgi:hypothetical protein
VEINCLLREGFSVQYITGQTTWSFRHELDGLGQIPVLNLISEIVPEYEPETVMRISGPHEGTLVNPKNYLFFQRDYKCFSCPSTSKDTISGLEVLCDADHFGRMYVSGIFVMEAPKLKGMGLNYVGHGHSYKVLRLTDERNFCDVEVLIKEIPTLLEHIKKTETKERVDGFVTSVAKLLQEEPESDIRYLSDFLGQPWYVPAAIKALAADLLGVF